MIAKLSYTLKWYSLKFYTVCNIYVFLPLNLYLHCNIPSHDGNDHCEPRPQLRTGWSGFVRYSLYILLCEITRRAGRLRIARAVQRTGAARSSSIIISFDKHITRDVTRRQSRPAKFQTKSNLITRLRTRYNTYLSIENKSSSVITSILFYTLSFF